MANQPHPSKKAVTYRLDGTLVDRVKETAEWRGETGLALVTRALERELREDSLRLRQVGWIGQSGRMYGLDEKPHETEPGSFTPMFVRIDR